MPLVRTIRSRGSTVVVEAHGEVLFTPTGPFGRWTNIFRERIEDFTARAAPVNKGWRWAHYDKPLRNTFDSGIDFDPAVFRVSAAVGSSARHALYVDQGTGIYGGRGPYAAKILPPWRPGSPSLYEARWVPPGSRSAVAPVMIRGQRGQNFFEKGLNRAFAFMRMRSYQVPADPRISELRSTAVSKIAGLLGNTPVSPGFVAQLQEWRSWRDERWGEGLALGHGKGRTERYAKRLSPRVARERMRLGRRPTPTQEERREQWAKASRRYRERQRREGRKAKPRKKTAGVSTQARAAMTRTMRAYAAKNPTMQILRADRDGFWVRPKRGGETRRINWSIAIIDLIYGRA